MKQGQSVQGGQWLAVLCCLLICAVPLAAAWAAPGISYGHDFIRAGKSWPDEAPLPARLDPAAALDPALTTRQRERLQELEAVQGPYAPGLAEPLAELGRSLSQAGDPGAALRSFNRALHVMRVNEGLYSENQLPLIKELLAAHRSLGDWRALDARYDYYYRLLHGAGAVQDARGAAEYFRWQREALRRELDSSDDRRLVQLFESNEQLLLAVDNTLPAAERWYLVDSQLRNLYLIQARARPDTLAVRSTAAPTFGFRQEPVQELDIYQQRLAAIQRLAEGRGTELLATFIAAPDLQDEALRARAWLALADWRQWNGAQGDALEDYRAVALHLQTTGQQSALEAWFGAPVELPDNGAFTRDPGAGGALVAARYRINDRGVAQDVETAALEEADSGFAMRLYRKLLRTRFRPRMEAGEPVASDPVERTYRYLDPEAIRRFRSP
ncbi:MAG: hypothetical protein NXH81_16905 [Halieaceae bacterium]|uniref:hypothetical protein n=1 Tax=Haliea alexandrii TaxID=2448162 RepID=UPI000F0B8D99|nr:hypothetical protein [Haliea alexandrii]MCR9187083.1 hypothetical protein [Halieaceae bacterium]